ncbi:hypothetical protein BDQ17DRAFT_1252395 [Cyathus striatus]|nr:hypothetical protein BDQ17DRAFT_1252395 [Cyathus striatus]
MPSGGLSSACVLQNDHILSSNDTICSFVQFCVEYSAIALLYYDYALTFPMEVKYIWGRKFRLSTFLYIFARYALVANIIYLLTLCNTGYMISAVLGILGRISVLVVWGMRTFAVYNRNPFVMILLGSIGLACVILNIVRWSCIILSWIFTIHCR